MANTYADYTGDGSNTDFAITFDYIKTAHVAVEINDGPAGGTNKWVRKTLTSDYTVVTSPAKKVVFNSAPANLVKVRVLRDSDANTGIVDFANGSVLTETELDNSYQHNRYLAEEAEEGKTGGALTKNETSGQFDADALRLENLADPDSDDDAVNKGYADNRYVDVAGDTMTGALDMGANKVTSSATPSSGNDLTNKTYTDATFVDVAGDTMSGELNMGSNKITNLADPTVDADAANKNYVDDTITTSLATGSPPPGVQLATAQIEDDAITYAKLQNIAANNVLLGNDNGTGVDVQELTAAEARTLLNVKEDGASDSLFSTKVSLGNLESSLATVATSGAYSDLVGTPTIPSSSDDLTEGTTNLFNQTHTGDVTGSTNLTLETVNSNVGNFTNANITVNAKGLVTAASSGSGSGTPNYSTGWQNSIDSVTVANGSTHTITHSLGTTNLVVQVYVADDANGANSVLVDYSNTDAGSDVGAQVQDITTTTLELQLGADGFGKFNSSGAASYVSFASKYIKVVVSASATVGAVSKATRAWTQLSSSADGTNFTFTHNLGTSDVIVQIYVNSSASDTGALSLDSVHEDDGGFTPGQGAVVTSIQSSNAITVQLGTNGYYSWSSSGVMTNTTFNSKYIKVVVIG